MKLRSIALLLAFGASVIGVPSAFAQCAGPGGVPFNCLPGNAIGPNDFLMGGSNTSSQAGRTVRWTAQQLATFVLTNPGGAASVPTDPTGLSSGTIWNNGGVMSIIP